MFVWLRVWETETRGRESESENESETEREREWQSERERERVCVCGVVCLRVCVLVCRDVGLAGRSVFLSLGMLHYVHAGIYVCM